MTKKVYKILNETEWINFNDLGEFCGSEMDQKDGFIHLSTENQIDSVIEKYFKNIRPIFLIEINDEKLMKNFKWEKATCGELYPHLYQLPLLKKHIASFKRLD